MTRSSFLSAIMLYLTWFNIAAWYNVLRRYPELKKKARVIPHVVNVHVFPKFNFFSQLYKPRYVLRTRMSSLHVLLLLYKNVYLFFSATQTDARTQGCVCTLKYLLVLRTTPLRGA